MSWRWVNRQVLVLLHDESLAEHGGGSGLRDEGLFESALMRPQNLAEYGKPDLADLAASYGVGLAKKRWWPQAAPGPIDELHRRVKAALDPKGILNPGKFLG